MSVLLNVAVRNRAVVAAVAGFGIWSVQLADAATTGVWAKGGVASWSVTGAGGWTNGVMPNAIGDVASIDNSNASASSTTTQNTGAAVTVGTISHFGTHTTGTDRSWIITGTNGVIMNQDGAGPQHALIQNSMSAAGNPGNSMVRVTGTLTLNDDLDIVNTSNSVRGLVAAGSGGSVQMQATMTGGGNLYISNFGGAGPTGTDAAPNGNDYTVGPIGFSAQGNFAGNTYIQKGAVTFNRGDVFSPNPSNVVTIGSASGGSATLMFTGGGIGNMENNFVAAAGSGGTLLFGAGVQPTSAVTIKSTNTNAASFTLNGDLSFTNLSTQLFSIGDQIVGAGKVTKIGTGAMRVSNTNSYAGGTVVNAGSLAVGNAPAVDTQFGHHDATLGTLGTGDVTVNSTALRLEIEAGVLNAIADTATLWLAGGGTLGTADAGYALLGTGIDETVGALLLGGIAQQAGTYGSSTSGATFQNDEFFSGSGIVTVVPEPTGLAGLALAAAGLCMRRRRH